MNNYMPTYNQTDLTITLVGAILAILFYHGLVYIMERKAKNTGFIDNKKNPHIPSPEYIAIQKKLVLLRVFAICALIATSYLIFFNIGDPVYAYKLLGSCLAIIFILPIKTSPEHQTISYIMRIFFYACLIYISFYQMLKLKNYLPLV